MGKFYRLKDYLLSLSCRCTADKNIQMYMRWWGAVVFAVVLLPAIIGTFIGSLYLLFYGTFRIDASVSLCFFMLCLVAVLYGGQCSFMQKNINRSLFFILIFIVGVCCYMQLNDELSKKTDEYKQYQIKIENPDSDQRFEVRKIEAKKSSTIKKIFAMLHNSHVATAAFFPSRGDYEIDANGTAAGNDLSCKMLFFYIIFHALVYIFAGYFVMSLWGARTLNRLKFLLVRDCEKYIFWCKMPDPVMLMLAKDILKNSDVLAIPVFSVRESAVNDPKALFREMNFQKFCLKLRKPEQIHTACLYAPRQLFISDDYNWNIRQANEFLKKREEKKISSPVELYIKINDEMETFYYEKWADIIHAESALNNKQIEIKFVNESALIAEELFENYPMLKSPGIEIDYEKAKIKKGKFRTLILGLGNNGKEILRTIIEDGQFLHLTEENENNPNFSIDIFEKNANAFKLFFKKYPDANRYCKMDIEHPEKYCFDIFSAEFYDYLQSGDNLSSYNRIVVCLGDDELNLNAAVLIEKIAKAKGISLKNKLFVVLTENNSFVDLISNAEQNLSENIDFKSSKIDAESNMIALGNPKKIFTYQNLIRTGAFEEQGKLVNLIYTLGKQFNYMKILKSEQPLKWFNDTESAMAYYNLKQTKTIPKQYKQGVVSFWDRKSSIASAKGYRNIILLQNDCTASEATKKIPKCVNGPLLETLAATEHLRWSAFLFMQGVQLWTPTKQEAIDVGHPNDIYMHMRHAALVDYDKLQDVDKLFGRPKNKLKKNDRDIILHIQKSRAYLKVQHLQKILAYYLKRSDIKLKKI